MCVHAYVLVCVHLSCYLLFFYFFTERCILSLFDLSPFSLRTVQAYVAIALDFFCSKFHVHWFYF